MKDGFVRRLTIFVWIFLLSCLLSVNVISEGGFSVSGTLSIPVDTTVIEDYAFYGCSSLTGPLKLPPNVKSIGNYAFANCSELSGRLVIPDSVVSIGEGAFSGCNQFDKVSVQVCLPDNTVTVVERTAVYCSPNSYAWTWAENNDEFEPVEASVWPERAIELIVPANPGGDTDNNARALAAALKEEMGWDVIVTNMAGGGGFVALEDCLVNPSNGYRFVFYNNNSAINELMGLYDFDIINDFKLAGMPFMDYSNAFLCNASNEKFKDLTSMVTFMKSHPEEVTFATEEGTFTHLQALAFERAAGVEFKFIDVGTASQRVTELAENRLDVIATQAGLGSVSDYEVSG